MTDPHPAKRALMKAIAEELERQTLGDYHHTRDFKTVRFDGVLDLERLADVMLDTSPRLRPFDRKGPIV